MRKLTSRKNKILGILSIIILAILLLIGASYSVLKMINGFFDTYKITFNQVVKVEFKEPITLVKREIISPVVITKTLDYPDDIDTPIEKYICEKFGAYDCKTALAVAKAESGIREDAIGINTNDTIDVGIF